MTRGVLIFAVVLSCFPLAACASKQPPPPDPLREEISILQRQHLELQKHFNETIARLDEALSAVSSLSARVSRLESQRTGSRSAAGKKLPPQTKTRKNTRR